MAQKVAFPLKRKKVTDSRKNRKKSEKKNAEIAEKYPGLLEIIEKKMKNQKEKSESRILEKYPDILEKIEKKMKTEELHPWVREFAGIISKGKNKN